MAIITPRSYETRVEQFDAFVLEWYPVMSFRKVHSRWPLRNIVAPARVGRAELSRHTISLEVNFTARGRSTRFWFEGGLDENSHCWIGTAEVADVEWVLKLALRGYTEGETLYLSGTMETKGWLGRKKMWYISICR